jgi:hypothetical protein
MARAVTLQSFGKFDQDASIGRTIDFLKCNDRAQPLDDAGIDLMTLKRPQQNLAPSGRNWPRSKAPAASDRC